MRREPTAARDVLITGASRGFGRLIAVELAVRGWRVFATMRDVKARAELERLVTAAGADVSCLAVIALDVGDPAAISEAVSGVLTATGGSLDAVVANAGVLIAGAFESTPAASIRRVMDVN